MTRERHVFVRVRSSLLRAHVLLGILVFQPRLGTTARIRGLGARGMGDRGPGVERGGGAVVDMLVLGFCGGFITLHLLWQSSPASICCPYIHVRNRWVFPGWEAGDGKRCGSGIDSSLGRLLSRRLMPWCVDG
jgi:hypothetical protein